MNGDLGEVIEELTARKVIICHPEDQVKVEKTLSTLGVGEQFDMVTSWACTRGVAIVGDTALLGDL